MPKNEALEGLRRDAVAASNRYMLEAIASHGLWLDAQRTGEMQAQGIAAYQESLGRQLDRRIEFLGRLDALPPELANELYYECDRRIEARLRQLADRRDVLPVVEPEEALP